MKVLKVIIICILIFESAFLFSQTRKIELNEIQINGVEYEISDSIFVTTQDSITFQYSVDANGNNTDDAFLFRSAIYFGNDSSVTNTGVNLLSYENLSQGNYLFSISAFDLNGDWKTNKKTVNIIVNDLLAKFYRQNSEFEEKINKKDSVIKSLKKSITKNEDSFLSNTYIFALIGISALLLIILIIVIIIFTNKLKNKKVAVDKKESKPKENIPIQSNKYAEENANLKAELTALRGQIDALQIRGEELLKQNNDLKINLDKINNKKTELEELQTQKDDLFALIIHDIKNPASLIKSLVELLTSYDLSANEQQEIINDIASTTGKIVQLSQEVSKIISLESNKLNMNFEKVDYKEIIKDVYSRNKIGADKKMIELFTDVNEELPDIEIDAFKIDEVLDNLISNAIKFTESGGMVRIKSYLDDGKVITEINDNGQGLSEDDIKKAFQRGKRLSAQPTAGESSTGLGLWIVKKLVEAHQGRVWVQSTLGKGSTFYFSLPVEKLKPESE